MFGSNVKYTKSFLFYVCVVTFGSKVKVYLRASVSPVLSKCVLCSSNIKET